MAEAVAARAEAIETAGSLQALLTRHKPYRIGERGVAG